tara:strand:+ start:82 stop:315 length:234 start_codon:yes stop_codon:yes gene_type:complete
MCKDPVDLAEQRRDREEMGLNIPIEIDPDTDYDLWVQKTRLQDQMDVINVLKTMHQDPLEKTIEKLGVLIDRARRRG